MVARIAPEPISTSLTVTEFRSRPANADSGAGKPPLTEDLLPPVLTPVPTPVPAPAIVPPSQAFAAALIAERLPSRTPDMNEVRLRLSGNWRAPLSPLSLTDRKV